ncbi:hypothetical protein [Butyrivibrio sp. VCB2006]|uniref:hypothetical protein n=1 Tax=Butyrivibrio sp. VCB2006 TaxID=1280679 RepID=UPI00042296BB|nr:hypothetical protein [Butyrivibrio sp. VCB2006]
MAFLVCLPIAGAIAYAFDKKIEEGIPIAMFIATFVTYLCGLFGFLTVSPVVVSVLAALSLGYCAWGIVREHSVRKYLTFGGVLYVILGAYYGLAARGRMVGEQDDLQVYAKYVSDFYHADKIYRFDYIPGMMMWEYLSERFWRVFSDSVLFWAMAMLCVGMMLAIFSSKEKKTKLQYVFVTLFVVLFPLSTKIREVYFVLQNDFVMGITMAYIVCMYLKARKYEDKFYEYASYMGFAFLTLTKVTGMVLAAILILMLFGIDVVSKSEKLSIKSMAYILKCTCAVLIAKLSWTIFVKLHGRIERFSDIAYKAIGILTKHWYLGIVCVLIIALLVWGFKWIADNGHSGIYIAILILGAAFVFALTFVIMPAEIRMDAVKNFVNVLFSTYAPSRDFGYGYRFLIPYAATLALLVFVWLIMVITSEERDSRANHTIIYINVGLILFSAFLFLSNYLTRDLSQAARAKECERYILAYITFYILTCVYMIVFFEKINVKIYKIILSFLLVFILMISNVSGLVGQVKAQDDYFEYGALNYIDIKYTDVFYCIDEAGSVDYSRFNYNISPGYMLNYYYSDMKLNHFTLGEGAEERYMTLDEFKDTLRRCTYVYVAATNEDFARDYGAVFADEIVDGRLYYVDKTDDNITLHSVTY